MSDPILPIYKNRFDMSDHLIHFTRKNGDSSAFETLKKIVKTGRINCGWSERNTRRTIFGKHPAVCFTEMPIISLMNYVKNRNDVSKVDFYGVALSKSNMFDLGARNVIYGVSHENDEAEEKENGERFTPFLTDGEQYRYMLTGIKSINDWTHEREWRWRNVYEKSNGDYLPIWKIENPIISSKNKYYGDTIFNSLGNIYLLVKTLKEAEELKLLLLEFDYPDYNIENIKKTYILPLQNITIDIAKTLTNIDSLLDSGICIEVLNS